MEGLTTKSSREDQRRGLRAWADIDKIPKTSNNFKDNTRITSSRKTTFMDKSENFTKQRITNKRHKQAARTV